MKTEKKKEMTKVEARWLVEERKKMEAGKKKVDEEIGRLKLELEELWAGFVVQKEELKVEY